MGNMLATTPWVGGGVGKKITAISDVIAGSSGVYLTEGGGLDKKITVTER